MAGSRLKQFTKIEPAHWDILEKIQRKGTSINLLNIVVEYPMNIKRTFCKCGYASGKEENACPVCGNDNVFYFKYHSGYSKNLETIEKVNVESIYSPYKGTNEDRVTLYRNTISIETTPASEFEVTETGDTRVMEFGEYEAVESAHIATARASYYSYEDELVKDIVSKYPYDLEGFKKFHSNRSLGSLLHFINYKREVPVVTQNIKVYPATVNHILTYLNKADFAKISSWEEVYPILGVSDKKLYPYVEAMIGAAHYWSKSKTVKDAFDKYETLDDEKKSIAEFFLIHGECDMDNFYELNSELSTISSEEIPTVAAFVRANSLSMGKTVLLEYKKRAGYLISRGVDVNPTNMDTRNYNLYRNKDYMVNTKKYNAQKVSYFLEMFDINPLESLQYLNTRRAPSKALKEELAEKLD